MYALGVERTAMLMCMVRGQARVGEASANTVFNTTYEGKEVTRRRGRWGFWPLCKEGEKGLWKCMCMGKPLLSSLHTTLPYKVQKEVVVEEVNF